MHNMLPHSLYVWDWKREGERRERGPVGVISQNECCVPYDATHPEKNMDFFWPRAQYMCRYCMYTVLASFDIEPWYHSIYYVHAVYSTLWYMYGTAGSGWVVRYEAIVCHGKKLGGERLEILFSLMVAKK